MTVGGSRPGREFSSLLIAALVVIPSLAFSAPARASDDCLLDYANCVAVASDLSSFGRRSAAVSAAISICSPVSSDASPESNPQPPSR